MSEIALSVENLTVSYGDIHAVKGISFEVKKGEIFTLIGGNGAGKSSTLRALSGLMPYGGNVRFNGSDLRGVAAEKIVRLGLAQVPEGRGIFGTLTIMENLKLGAWIRKDRKGVAEDIDHVMTSFPRLRERKDQISGTLSGGEQQMLAVARALMSRATMLLLDEPSMGLAPKLIKEIYAVISEINKSGVTILLVEQNANLALKLAQRAGVLETGTLALMGESAELLKNSRVREAYLGA
ncbi:MAG: ABC transporter ATP-binding protein [Chthoniobacterales bacterium]